MDRLGPEDKAFLENILAQLDEVAGTEPPRDCTCAGCRLRRGEIPHLSAQTKDIMQERVKDLLNQFGGAVLTVKGLQGVGRLAHGLFMLARESYAAGVDQARQERDGDGE